MKKLVFILTVNILAFVSLGVAADEIKRKHVFPWEKQVGYSQVTQVGKTLYLAGLTSGKADFEAQLKDIYTRIESILSEYNVGTERIVKEVIYTTDIEQLKAATELRKSYYKKQKYPASSWVQVSALFQPGLKIEIEVVAVLP